MRLRLVALIALMALRRGAAHWQQDAGDQIDHAYRANH